MGSPHNPTIRSLRTRAVVGAAFALATSLAVVPTADAIIVSGGQSMPAPSNGYVGWWAGSTGVCVGEYWIVTAKHVGGSIGGLFYSRGIGYFAVEIVPHPSLDVQLVRLDRPLPGWHRIGAPAEYGDRVVLGGYGVTTSAPLADNAGWDWGGDQAEAWGANTVSSTGNLTVVTFDRPTAASAVPYEATYAVHDSGAGLFTLADDNELELVGIAVSVTGWGQSRWGYSGFCINSDLFRNWAAPIIDPSAPISSGVVAPRSMLSIPGVPAWAGGAMLAWALRDLRRRR